jgi:O-antigen/teichoic acid export membrane protein
MYLWTILPIFFAKFAKNIKEPEQQQKFFNFGHIICSVPMTFVCVFIFFYGEKLFFQFDTNTLTQIAEKSYILKILFIATLLNGIFALYSTLLTSTGYELHVSKMIVGSIFINIILNYLYIPLYGSVAAAWVTVVSTAFLSFSYLVFIHYKTNIKIPFNILFRLLFVYALFAFVFYLLKTTCFKTILFSGYIEWYWVSILSGFFLIILCYLFGLLKIVLQKNGKH